MNGAENTVAEQWRGHSGKGCRTMRNMFLKWLLFFIVIAFAVTFVATYSLQTHYANEHAEQLIGLNLVDVKKQLALNARNVAILRKHVAENGLAKARALAHILALSPAAATDGVRLVELLRVLGVDEINVADGRGILVGSTEPRFVGYDMGSAAQSAFFMPLLTDPKLELLQDPQPIGFDARTLMQYAGVPRRDGPGFVQVGYRSESFRQTMNLVDPRKTIFGLRVGAKGVVMICENNHIISVDDSSWLGSNLESHGIPTQRLKGAQKGKFTAVVRGVPSLCLFEHLNGYTIIGTLPKNEMYVNRNAMCMQMIVFNLVLFAMVFVLISTLVQRVVISGIYKVNSSLEKITQGDLEEKVRVDANEEFVMLSNGINTMVSAMKQAMAEVARRLDAELEFASAIQHASLPSVFPPYPDRRDVEIFAAMHTAKEVGGDFYDFFLIDGTHLALVMADVSGKGIPAALFMMTSKTMLKNYAEAGLSPAQVFNDTNRHLCANNEAGMFVTAFLGILDTDTGVLSYVNAGHNPPYLRRVGGRFEALALTSGFVLAGLDDQIYEQDEVQLRPGDTLFMYTDGVTEAQNAALELYSEERLERCLARWQNEQGVEALIHLVERDIETFAAGADRADDITMLAITYCGNAAGSAEATETPAAGLEPAAAAAPGMSELVVPAALSALPAVQEFVLGVMLSHGDCLQVVRGQLELVVEELFVNIAHYAYAPGQGEATLRCGVMGAPPELVMQFIDSGRPYNPLDKADPDVDASLAEREIGGLGIYIVKNTMDAVEYEYRDGRNILTIRKKLITAEPPTSAADGLDGRGQA